MAAMRRTRIDFSGDDKAIINTLLIKIGFLCNLKDHERVFLEFIRSRTWNFGKYGCTIYPFEFKGIFAEKYIQVGPGATWDRARRSRIRSSLVSKGMLFYDPDDHLYLINLPGLVGLWRSVCARYLGSNVQERESLTYSRALLHFGDLFGRAYFHPIHLDEVCMSETLKMLEAGRKKSEDAVERKRAKVKGKPAEYFLPKDIVPLMREFCESYGMTFYDEWTGREKRSAKNWLKYCLEDEKDPRTILEAVVEHWNSFRVNALQREDGSAIMLKPTVSFSEFFIHRKAIEAFLTGVGGAPEVVMEGDEEMEMTPAQYRKYIQAKYSKGE